jgi:tripartite-type tricarboxylate transporter receptor subunit TctC
MEFIIPKRKLVSGMVAVSLGLVVGSAFAADEFPNKPIRIIVPAAVGGGLDAASRLVGQKMSEKLGVQVIIDNRAGAETMLGTRVAKDAPADGYTILGQAPGFTLLPYIKNDPGFDPLKDFTGLGMLYTAPMVMEVAASAPDQTVQALVARAKTKSLSYGTGGQATPQQIASAMFMQAAGMSGHQEIPFKGAGPTLIEIAAGRLDFTFDGYNSSKPLIDSGKLRPLAVTGPVRMPQLPNVPTFKEAGYNFTFRLWLGLMVPKGTPPAAIQRLSDALKYALTSKDIIDRWRSDGADAAESTFLTPEEMNDFLKKDYERNAQVAVDLKYEKQ